MTRPKLYDYWRSSASYRVRIALNLKGIEDDAEQVDLLAGSHRTATHLARNPQGLLPALEIDGHCLTQSLAIIEYLDETRPDVLLIPKASFDRARVRALSHAIAMEIHPVCNLKVAAHVVELTRGGDASRKAWMQKFIGDGLAAFEAMLEARQTGLFCHGDQPTMADCCLIPQVYNAARWQIDIRPWPRIVSIAETCGAMPAFADACPPAA